MKRFDLELQIFLIVAIALFAAAPALAQMPQVGDRITSFEMAWVQRDVGEVAKRAQAVAEVMLGRKLTYEGIEKSVRESAPTDWRTSVPDALELLIRYIPERDELRLIHTELLSVIDARQKIDERGAIELVKKAIEELDRRGVVKASHYDLERAQIGYHRVSAGPLEGTKAYDRVTEYRITLRRVLNGIEIANAGIRFSVHASGQLAAIRLGGVSVSSKTAQGMESPMAQGSVQTRKVSSEAIERRFYESMPENAVPEVAWSKVLYVMPEDREKAVVEPLQVFSYSTTSKVDGQAVVSRRKVVGYSLTDAEAKPIDFTAPGEVEADAKPRESAS